MAKIQKKPPVKKIAKAAKTTAKIGKARRTIKAGNAAKPVTALPRSHVTFLLDRSGSMESIKSNTIEGFNAFLSGLKAETAAEIRFTFLQFDSVGLDKIVVDQAIETVPLLTHHTFLPRGGTPLIDAAVKTIRAVEAATAAGQAAKVIICIQTDGEENSSTEYGWNDLARLVKAKQECGWQFSFLGAGIDAYKQAQRMSIDVANTISYGLGRTHTQSAFRSAGANAASFSSGMAGSVSYSSHQKVSAGDVFDPLQPGKLGSNMAPKGTGS